jgi:hypothetical protein
MSIRAHLMARGRTKASSSAQADDAAMVGFGIYAWLALLSASMTPVKLGEIHRRVLPQVGVGISHPRFPRQM